MDIKMHNADCMDFMRELPDKYYDLAIVDPPYGINLAEWDKETPKQKYFDEIRRVSVNQIIWGGNYFVDKLPITEAWICWNKKPFLKQQAHFELAWTSFEMKTKMIEYTYAGNCEGLKNVRVDYTKKSIHPTQKPVALYELLLMNYAKEGDKILDTHGGSGSICIACHNLGFDLDWIELDKDYFDAATKRFKQHAAQLRIM
jgi:site-specific DNA-methyltransferase (adenine-specific)